MGRQDRSTPRGFRALITLLDVLARVQRSASVAKRPNGTALMVDLATRSHQLTSCAAKHAKIGGIGTFLRFFLCVSPISAPAAAPFPPQISPEGIARVPPTQLGPAPAAEPPRGGLKKMQHQDKPQATEGWGPAAWELRSIATSSRKAIAR